MNEPLLDPEYEKIEDKIYSDFLPTILNNHFCDDDDIYSKEERQLLNEIDDKMKHINDEKTKEKIVEKLRLFIDWEE